MGDVKIYEKLNIVLSRVLDKIKCAEDCKNFLDVGRNIELIHSQDGEYLIVTLNPDYDEVLPTCFLEAMSLKEWNLLQIFMEKNHLANNSSDSSIMIRFHDAVKLSHELNKLTHDNDLFSIFG